MSITRVQANAQRVTTATNTVTLGAGVTQGNLLIASYAIANTGGTITTPAGWTLATGNAGSFSQGSSLYYIIVSAPLAGTTAFAFTSSVVSNNDLIITEWNSSTGWLASPLDQVQSAHVVNATTVSSGTTPTTVQAVELWAGALAYGATAQVESGLTAGWTSGIEATGGPCLREVYQVVSATGAASVQLTIPAGVNNSGVVATFFPVPAVPPVLATSPATLSFTKFVGGGSPASQNDTLSETANAGTTWTSAISYGSGSGWLAISPTSGTLTPSGSQVVAFTCTTGALAAGTYTATVTYTATIGGATATVGVTFIVTAAPHLAVAASALSFTAFTGGANPASQTDALSNSGGTTTAWTVATVYGAGGTGWLALAPTSGTLAALASHTITYTCSPGALPLGTYTATVTFTATTGGSTVVVTVTFNISPSPSVTVAGTSMLFDEETFALSTRLDERQRFQVTVLDYAGTQQFAYRQKVVVTDAVLGVLYSGFVADAKQDKTKTYPDPTTEHLLDCFDNRGLVDKVTSKWLYANQYAGTIAVHQAQKYLAAEGITVAAALDWDEQLTDWQAGTLVGTLATSNAYDGNPGDGDLELALAGSVVTKSASTTANWNAGTLTNVVGASNQLVLTSHAAAKFTSFCNGYSGGNNFIYESFYTQDYTIANGDTLIFSMWISSSSPAITASVNGWCSDGSHTYNLLDSNLLSNNPNTDLTGYANDQWYTRSVDLSSLAGKTLENLNFCFAGNSKGVYTAYYHDVLIKNGVTTKVSAFTGSLQDNGKFPYHFGYDTTQTSITTIKAYDASGTRISNTTSLTPAGVLKSGYITWTATTPNTSTAVFSTSFDGGVTWQVQTQNSALVGILAGADATGKTLLTQIALAINGPDPTRSPAVSLLVTTINPSYAATKSDVTYTKNLTADFNAGTFTNTAAANNQLTLNGAWRNWINNDVSGMTIFGSGTPHIDTAANQVRLTATPGGDCRTRMDFAGTYSKLDMSVDFAIPINPGTSDNCGLEWGTTNWGNSLNSYAYNAFVNLTGITFAHGTNSTGAGGFNSIQTSTFPVPLNQGDWHTLRVVWDGSINSTSLYIDGSLTFTNLDATYTAAGNVAMRYFNSSGGLYAGNFNNFSVVKTYANTKWVSPTYSLNSVGTCGNSQLTWQDVLPASSVLLVESTINGGGVWSACTNGGVIPGLTNGVSCTGVNLQIRVTFTEAIGQETMFQGFTAWVMSQYSSSGTRVSPSLSLVPVGRAGTALVNWNANLPTNTSLVVKTSTDAGATYQTIGSAGGAIPTITTQPAPIDDSFVTDTSANYANTHGAGGTNAIVTYDTANSRITMVGGTSALYIEGTSASGNGYAGVTIGLNPGIGNAGSPYTFWTLLFADMAAQGLTTVRFQLSWGSIELTQGNYTWTALDDAVLNCNAAGVRLMYTIRGAPPWGLDPANGAQQTNTEPFYIMSPTLAAGFVTQVMTRYDGTHGHGKIDVICFNEDFSIHNTSTSDTLTLNGTVTAGVPITSFPITASGFTPTAGTKIYFGSYSSTDIATVTTNVALGDTTVHVSSFTPASTYTATQVLPIGYVGINTSSPYPGLFGSGNAVTTLNKIQPSRDFTYAWPVYTAVYNAVRAISSTVPVGFPVVWWTQPINIGHIPNTSVSVYTASLQTMYTAGVPMDALTFIDFHHYSNNVDPTVGSNQSSTISQAMTDCAAVAAANGDAGRAIYVTEFGYQADNTTTSSTTIAAGTRTITLASGVGSAAGGTALIDSVASGVQETVTITARTNTTITAVFANAHTASYPVVINLDCSVAAQATRYTAMMTAIQGASPKNQFMFFTMDYNTTGGGTGSSLVMWNGSSYVYQPAWTNVGTYIAAHPATVAGDTVTDVDLFIDMDKSDFGGLVWRFIDANNYYEMAVRDASSPGSAAPNTVQCFKMLAGVKTTIGPINTRISFARGVYRRIRVTMLGNTITAFLDGTQLLSFTDTSISTAGQCGLRNDTFGGASTARFYRLRVQPLGDDVTAKSLLTKVTLTSTDPTVTPQLLDMQAFVASPAIGAGTLIPSASYVRTFVDANLDDLAGQSNYGWYVDQVLALHFQGRTAQPAPWILSSNTIRQPSDIEADSNLLVESAGTVYRNRQILTNVIGSATYTDPFVGNGTLTSFSLRYPVAPGTIPVITLNNNKQTVGLQGTSGSNWYYAVGSVTIAQDTSGTVLVGTDTLSVAYTGTFTTEVVVNNTAAQTALAAVEGGSGIVEAVEDVSAKNMTVAAATTYANQLLIRNCIVDANNLPTGRTLTYKTYHNGLVVGQSQTVFFPEEHLNDIELYITQIDVQMQTQPGFTTLYNYIVTCTELPKIDSWPKLLASGLVD